MKHFKQTLALLLVLALALAMAACGQVDQQPAFDAFVSSLPALALDPTDSVLNQLFADKQAAGFADETYEWPTYSLSDFVDDQNTWRKQYDTLLTFDRAALAESQQVTYDILQAALRDAQHDPGDENFFYLSNNPLGQYQGNLSDFPITFYFFNLYNKGEMESYLHLMETLPDYAAEMLRFEQERQDKGFGLTPREIEAVKEMCDANIDGDLQFLADDFSAKVDEADFLTEQEKADAKARCAGLLESGFRQAYKDIRAGLDQLDVNQQDGANLSDMPGGQEYYAYLVESCTGFTDMQEYAQYLVEKTEEARQALLAVDTGNPGLWDDWAADQVQIYSSEDPNQILAHLKGAIAADFPAVREVDYVMEVLPESMQALMPGVGAFYMIGTLDRPDATQRMMLNGDYKQTDFATIAHEGYPGHMYQNVYYSSVEHPLILDLLSFSGYAEGYATYVESLCGAYADLPAAVQLDYLYNHYLLLNYLQFDFMLNYSDMDAADVRGYLCDLFSIEDPESEDAWLVLGDVMYRPGAFLPYHIGGSLIGDLRAEAEEALGAEFDPVAFHDSLLKRGPMSLDLLAQYVRSDLGLADQSRKAAA